MDEPAKRGTGSKNRDSAQKLLERGTVCPGGRAHAAAIEIRRGMSICSREGVEVGKVAALAVERESGEASHLLLSRLPRVQGYWLVPADSIVEVSAEQVRLSISEAQAASLEAWHAA